MCFAGLFKLQDLVKSPPSVRTEMYIRQAGPRSYRQVLREVRHKEIFKLIVDTDPAHMQQFFRAVSFERHFSITVVGHSWCLNVKPRHFLLPHVLEIVVTPIFLFRIRLTIPLPSREKYHSVKTRRESSMNFFLFFFPHRLISRMINLTSYFIQLDIVYV